MIRKAITDIFTEPDGVTICPARVIAIFGALGGVGLAFYDVIALRAHFDFQAYGIGLGATLAALGAALGFKKDSPTP